jgi:hypothetical protein
LRLANRASPSSTLPPWQNPNLNGKSSAINAGAMTSDSGGLGRLFLDARRAAGMDAHWADSAALAARLCEVVYFLALVIAGFRFALAPRRPASLVKPHETVAIGIDS